MGVASLPHNSAIGTARSEYSAFAPWDASRVVNSNTGFAIEIADESAISYGFESANK